MATSITTSLGAGSGIDIKSLTEQLAAASKAPREALIVRREEANKAKVSALANAMSGLDSFSTALSTLTGGGTLLTQPTVSDSDVLTATALPGSRLGALTGQIEVLQLAQAQTLASAPVPSATAAIGQGTLTLTTAAGSFDLAVGADNDSLAGLARTINENNAGVSASVITDGAGAARLVLKGATGARNAFSLSTADTSGLERFTYDAVSNSGGLTRAQTAQDAVVKLDGVEVSRPSNSIGGLISGVQLELKKPSAGSPVSIGTKRPTEALGQAVRDFVDAFNEMRKILDTATAAPKDGGSAGPLRGDLALQEMSRELARIPSRTLNSGGGFASLSQVGVATNRDGTLRVDPVRLNEALASDPAGVEALFNPTQYSSTPLVSINSKMGRTKPGTYTLTDLIPASGGQTASGKINGVAANPVESLLVAPAGSPAVGLVVDVKGAVASATITVDPGIGGAITQLRDALRKSSGPVASSEARLKAESKRIAADRTAMERQATSYSTRLLTNFTNMERRVSSSKATQSYLEQQVKIWTNG